jgi:hypothetical protein
VGLPRVGRRGDQPWAEGCNRVAVEEVGVEPATIDHRRPMLRIGALAVPGRGYLELSTCRGESNGPVDSDQLAAQIAFSRYRSVDARGLAREVGIKSADDDAGVIGALGRAVG